METDVTVLVVEDDINVLPALTAALRVQSPYRVLSAWGFDGAKVLLQSEHVDVLLADVILPNFRSGIELAQVAKGDRPDIAVVLMSADSRHDLGEMPVGSLFLAKPFETMQLLGVLEAALATSFPH